MSTYFLQVVVRLKEAKRILRCSMSVDTVIRNKTENLFGFINSLKYLCFGTGGPSGNMAFQTSFLFFKNSSFMSFRNCSFQIDQPWFLI
jgi:hypothetical protein